MWALRYATGVVSSISGRPRKPSSMSPSVKARSQRVTCSGVASRPAGLLYAGVCIPAYFRRLFRIPCRRVYSIRRTGVCTARGRSSLIPSRISPRWRATLHTGARWKAALRARESLDGSNHAAREPAPRGGITGTGANGVPLRAPARTAFPRQPQDNVRNFLAEAAASAGAGPSPGASEWLPSQRPPGDARGGRRALGAACRGTDGCVRCAIGVRASPPGRGVGSSRGALLSRRAPREKSIAKNTVIRRRIVHFCDQSTCNYTLPGQIAANLTVGEPTRKVPATQLWGGHWRLSLTLAGSEIW